MFQAQRFPITALAMSVDALSDLQLLRDEGLVLAPDEFDGVHVSAFNFEADQTSQMFYEEGKLLYSDKRSEFDAQMADVPVLCFYLNRDGEENYHMARRIEEFIRFGMGEFRARKIRILMSDNPRYRQADTLFDANNQRVPVRYILAELQLSSLPDHVAENPTAHFDNLIDNFHALVNENYARGDQGRCMYDLLTGAIDRAMAKGYRAEDERKFSQVIFDREIAGGGMANQIKRLFPQWVENVEARIRATHPTVCEEVIKSDAEIVAIWAAHWLARGLVTAAEAKHTFIDILTAMLVEILTLRSYLPEIDYVEKADALPKGR